MAQESTSARIGESGLKSPGLLIVLYNRVSRNLQTNARFSANTPRLVVTGCGYPLSCRSSLGNVDNLRAGGHDGKVGEHPHQGLGLSCCFRFWSADFSICPQKFLKLNVLSSILSLLYSLQYIRCIEDTHFVVSPASEDLTNVFVVEKQDLRYYSSDVWEARKRCSSSHEPL